MRKFVSTCQNNNHNNNNNKGTGPLCNTIHKNQLKKINSKPTGNKSLGIETESAHKNCSRKAS